MSYTEQTWTDGSAGGTPLSAARLTHIEDGIFAASGVASTIYVAASTASTQEKNRADYVCTGTNDHTTINSAISAARTAGSGVVLLSAGTFYCAGQIQMWGIDDVNTEIDLALIGQGPSATILRATTNITGGLLNIAKCVRVRVEELGLYLGFALTTDGITSTASTSAGNYRSFWNSSFRRIEIRGDWASHSAWALNLDSPFRSIFQNIEVGGTGKGMRMFSSNSAFNPGDCLVQRCFMDLVGTNTTAYSIESTTANGNMNQLVFEMCEGITSGTGGTGIYIGGTGATPGPVNHTTWHGINLEQFDTIVRINNGQSNRIELNYVEPREVAGNTFIQFDTNAMSNRILSIGSAYTASTTTLIKSTATSTSMPNLVEQVALLADTGATVTNNISTAGAVIKKWITNNGPGTATSVLVTPA